MMILKEDKAGVATSVDTIHGLVGSRDKEDWI